MANDFSAFTVDGVTNTDFNEMNKGVTPMFKIIPLPDPARSEAEGHPCFSESEEVTLFVAGDTFNVVNHPVTDEIRKRFPSEYAAWKANRDISQINGTPLSMWPEVAPALRMEFEALNIRSVEDLAAVSDGNISRIMDGRVWRAKAAAWLELAKDSAVATKYAAENERLREDMERMQKQIAELVNTIKEQSAGEPKRRGAA